MYSFSNLPSHANVPERHRRTSRKAMQGSNCFSFGPLSPLSDVASRLSKLRNWVVCCLAVFGRLSVRSCPSGYGVPKINAMSECGWLAECQQLGHDPAKADIVIMARLGPQPEGLLWVEVPIRRPQVYRPNQRLNMEHSSCCPDGRLLEDGRPIPPNLRS